MNTTMLEKAKQLIESLDESAFDIEQWRNIDQLVDGLHNPYLLASAVEREKFYSGERVKLVRQYTYTIPTAEIVRAIADWGPLVEIGAGGGYWAYLLRQLGCHIVCYDNFKGTWRNYQKKWSKVYRGTQYKVTKHQDKTLFLCWPYMDRMAQHALELYRGNRVIYIGEWGACTANDEFHHMLSKDWREVKCLAPPQYNGIHDYVWFFERKGVDENNLQS